MGVTVGGVDAVADHGQIVAAAPMPFRVGSRASGASSKASGPCRNESASRIALQAHEAEQASFAPQARAMLENLDAL